MQLDKKKLYEDIMHTISKEVKRSLNENNGSLSQADILHYMESGIKSTQMDVTHSMNELKQ